MSQNIFVVIVAFGKISAEKIAKVLYSLQVNYKIISPEEIPKFYFSHIILSGGPKHVYKSNHYPLPSWVLNTKCRVLGICYGMQLVAHTFGGVVSKMKEKERGCISVTEIINTNNKIEQVTNFRWMNRKDHVIYLPEIFDIIGVTSTSDIATFTDYKKWYCVQYHPESDPCNNISLFRTFLQ